MQKIVKIRRDGYVFSQHTVVQGAGMIGMLIKNPRSGRQLALSVHAPVERLEAKHALIVCELETVCAAASALDS